MIKKTIFFLISFSFYFQSILSSDSDNDNNNSYLSKTTSPGHNNPLTFNDQSDLNKDQINLKMFEDQRIKRLKRRENGTKPVFGIEDDNSDLIDSSYCGRIAPTTRNINTNSKENSNNFQWKVYKIDRNDKSTEITDSEEINKLAHINKLKQILSNAKSNHSHLKTFVSSITMPCLKKFTIKTTDHQEKGIEVVYILRGPNENSESIWLMTNKDKTHVKQIGLDDLTAAELSEICSHMNDPLSMSDIVHGKKNGSYSIIYPEKQKKHTDEFSCCCIQ